MASGDGMAVSTWTELAERYDGFIFDLYGVLHNGVHALPGAPELITQLKRMGKKLVILSNSSKRSPWVLKEIPKLGLDAAAFLGAITSGEEAWKALRERSGQRCVWLSKVDGSGVTDYLEGTGVSLADVDEADFILNGGTAAIRTQDCMWPVDCEETGNLEPYTELFKLAISRGLPMICANPDFRSPAKPGKRQEYCAGYVAQHYEELGGVVQYFGKPHSPHFEAARRFLGDVAACHVGDSMIHDVAGARAAALPVVFVAGGIEHQELGIEPGQTPTPDALLRLAERYGIQPLVQLGSWGGASKRGDFRPRRWHPCGTEPLLARDVERQVLHLGNGNSPLPEEMFDAGYVQQTAVDISEAAMTHMEARNRGCRPSIVWKAADCRRLDIPSDSFPLVVDKSTLDAFFCHDQHALAIMEFVKEAFRVTAVGGALISVSMHRPKSVLPWLRHKAFAWNVTTIPIEDGQPSARARPRCHAYICGPKRCEAQKSLEALLRRKERRN
ncbi:eEF1A lysine and N-terminal methyltransferase (Methyltransferase-like protein 13) [Includes: eEF1A lysine methyltransferase [Durusdinium trenchii]|uniref:EEF1A lysine and N-terminal methyltransferase (Methyltransferase-like protein 13) n=1 Tax=Durusdinium trenchii TaxID=1381693 RepID=A0ABP0L1W2_9DINO